MEFGVLMKTRREALRSGCRADWCKMRQAEVNFEPFAHQFAMYAPARSQGPFA